MTSTLLAPLPAAPGLAGGRRVVLYSHDTQGLGHIRRNLGIAGALGATEPAPSILMVSGAVDAGRFRLPPHTDLLTLPALAKSGDGHYAPRTLATSLDALVSLRGHTIAAALDAFDPDVLVVDKVATGVSGELRRALRVLRARGRTRIVLGLRDVLDAPEVVAREWRRDRTVEAIRAWYDEVWIYGDPRIFDPVAEYRFPADVAAKVRYTGYLAPSGHGVPAPPGLPPRFALCSVGGGQDGQRLAQAFLDAPVPAGLGKVLVTGPFMAGAEASALARRAEGLPGVVVLDFVRGCEGLAARAEAAVSMGGYNAVLELLAAGVPTLVVPRVRPRREQLLRAERMAAHGLLDLLHPDALSPHALGRWLRGGGRRPCARAGIDLGGLPRLPALLDALLDDGGSRHVAG